MENDKISVWETQIIDMMQTIKDRYDEIDPSESDFESGRQEAYQEMLEIIKTRYKMIYDVLESDDGQ